MHDKEENGLDEHMFSNLEHLIDKQAVRNEEGRGKRN
jgi:hypothetical protein